MTTNGAAKNGNGKSGNGNGSTVNRDNVPAAKPKAASKSSNGKGYGKQRAGRPTKTGKAKAGSRMADQYAILQATTTMHSDYVHHLIDPDSTDARRVPDGVTATSAIFKTPTVKVVGAGGTWDSANAISRPVSGPDGAGESIVGIFPGVASSIWVTSGNEHTVVPTLFLGETVYETCVGLIDQAEPGLVQHARHAIMDCQHAVLPRFSTGELRWIYEVEAHTDLFATSIFEIAATFDPRDGSKSFGATSLQFELHTRAHSTGAWTMSTFQGTLLTGQVLPFANLVATVTAPDYIDAFSVSVSHVSETKALDGDLIIKIVGASSPDASIIKMPAYSSMHFTVDSWADLDALTATSAERVTALSCLLTYMGSSLQNGGVIAGARLATGITIQDAPDGDIYSYLASLPTYSADFALKDGAYAWWAPDSVEEQFFTPYNQPPMNTRNNTSLWFAANRDDISQTLRARVVMGIETITRARTYNARIGPVNPNYALLLALAKTLPAVTENPLHDMLGNVWNDFTDLISSEDTWRSITDWGLSSLFG
jgi:hypothetical protein